MHEVGTPLSYDVCLVVLSIHMLPQFAIAQRQITTPTTVSRHLNNLSQVINYVHNDRGGGKRSWSYAGTRIGGRRGWRHVGGGRGGNEKEVTVTLLEGEEEEGVTGAVLGRRRGSGWSWAGLRKRWRR